MPAGAFEKTNFGWQIQQVFQQAEEWFELQFSRLPDLRPQLSNSSLPSGFSEVILKLLELGVWIALGLVLTWLGQQLYRLLSPYFSTWKSQTSQVINRLPRQDPQSAADWVRQAQELQRQNNYREACRAIYMAMLQRLDETKLVAHQPGRTDGEYLQLVQSLPQPQPYEFLITTHEQLYFGNAPISSTTLSDCQQAYQQLESQLVSAAK